MTTTVKGHVEIRHDPKHGWQYRWVMEVPWETVPKQAAAGMTEIAAGRQIRDMDREDQLRIERQLYNIESLD